MNLPATLSQSGEVSAREPVRPRLLALDLDETVFPLGEALRSLAYGSGADVGDSTWEGLLQHCRGDEARRLELLTRACEYEYARGIGLIPGAAEALQALTASGVRIHVVTARDEPLAVAGVQLLVEQRVPLAGVACAAREKVTLVQALAPEGAVLCDDDPEVHRRALAAGLSSCALRSESNADALDALGVPSADNWSELGDLIAELVGVGAAHARSWLSPEHGT